MKKVLIIGSRGFTGRYVQAELKAAGNVDLVEAHTHQLDIRNTTQFGQVVEQVNPDCILNLAAVSTLSLDDIENIYELNAMAVIRAWQWLKDAGFDGRFIQASSAYVYGDHTPDPIRETQPLRPSSHYACAKAMTDQVADLYRPELDIIIARPFNCIGLGHGSSFLVPKIIDHFKNNKPQIELGALTHQRDFVDIRDIAAMYRAIIEASKPEPVFNFANGRGTSVGNIVTLMEQITDHTIQIKNRAELIRQQDNPLMVADISNLQELGFKPKYSLEDTLHWMLATDPNQ